MDKLHKEALQLTKEIVVKFIEVQRISPASFGEIFPAVHQVVLKTVLEADKVARAAAEGEADPTAGRS